MKTRKATTEHGSGNPGLIEVCRASRETGLLISGETCMNTGIISLIGQFKLKYYLGNAIMGVVRVLLFFSGILLASTVLILAAMMAPFAAFKIGQLQRELRKTMQASRFEQDFKEGATVIEGKYKVTDS
jgi:hypothetical protein